MGAEALQFLRIRHGIGDGSDLGRISNQQQFMSSMVRKLQSESVLANPGTLLNFATTALSQVNQGQLVLSSGLTNPSLMVQIAMAVKDVPYEDIVFVQYPTVVRARRRREPRAAGDGCRRRAVRRAAREPGDHAHRRGEPGLRRRGGGRGDQAPVATPSATPDAAATPGATESAAPVPEERVALPDDIAGTTAAQVTCTRPEG